MKREIELLAVLGRNMYLDGKTGWHPSRDLAVWGVTNDYYGSVANQDAVDESSSDCFLGGGELNILAGVELYDQYRPRLVVCAYGDRANYLKEAGGPTESEVDTAEFQRLANEKLLTPEVKVWTDEMRASAFNTLQELLNIFDLAVLSGLTKIGLVTIVSHLPRTIFFANRHLASVEKYEALRVEYFAAELVLAAANPARYVQRVLGMFSSLAFTRSAGLEAKGVRDFLAGNYGKK